MTRLIYIHDTLYFDDKPINELNYTERGRLQDYVDELPDAVDVITVEEAENIRNNAEKAIKDYKNSKQSLIADKDIDKEDLIKDFIDVLESLAY